MKTALGHREAAELCCVNYKERMAFGAFDVQDGVESLRAVGRYYLDLRRNMAEIAIVVHEDFRRRGIARYLIGQLTQYASKIGVRGFFSEVLPTNVAVLEVHRKLGHDVIWSPEDGVYCIQYALEV